MVELQVDIYEQGMEALQEAWSVAFSPPAMQERGFNSWLRLACTQQSRVPKVPVLTLPDFTGNHWSRLAFEHLSGLPQKSIATTKELRMSSHLKNVADVSELSWKWRMKSAFSAFASLERLVLDNCVDDDVMAAIASLKSLKYVRLSGFAMDLSDEGLEDFVEILADQNVLEEIDMTGLTVKHTHGISAKGVAALCTLPTLGKLGLHIRMLQDCSTVCGSESPLRALCQNATLKTLNLSFTSEKAMVSGNPDYVSSLPHLHEMFPEVEQVAISDFSLK